jgi:hypothetical protein
MRQVGLILVLPQGLPLGERGEVASRLLEPVGSKRKTLNRADAPWPRDTQTSRSVTPRMSR